ISITNKVNPISTFDNEYNHFAGNKIKQVKVFGERCSGTNFLNALIDVNFPEQQMCYDKNYGPKHFLCWFVDHPFEKNINAKYKKKSFQFNASSKCLFVVVVRNPYDWLRSFFNKPHEVHHSLLNKGFSHFLRSEWRHWNGGPGRKIDNYNPWTKKPFSNVLDLRKYKILNYLTLGRIVDNYLFVRYEDVRENPNGFVDFIAENYSLVKEKDFIPITTYKGCNKTTYTQTKYFSFSEKDLLFINTNIDWKMEEKINYFLNKNPD
ncbi:MAG: hypothetical protein AAGG81_03560, partial [Chlamydiota bacterium]